MFIRQSNYTLFTAHQYDKNRTVHQDHFPSDVMQQILALKNELEFPEQLALNHAAYGKLTELETLLDEQPLLVVIRGDVTTPGGLYIENTTLLECAIFSGDFRMVETILSYFDQFE